MVMFKRFGVWYATPKENYYTYIQNARHIYKLSPDFETALGICINNFGKVEIIND